jgi:hypothetical protein
VSFRLRQSAIGIYLRVLASKRIGVGCGCQLSRPCPSMRPGHLARSRWLPSLPHRHPGHKTPPAFRGVAWPGSAGTTLIPVMARRASRAALLRSSGGAVTTVVIASPNVRRQYTAAITQRLIAMMG